MATKPPSVFSLLVINKAGGLIYQKTFADGLAPLTQNEYLILAGTFHGMHAIASRISPVERSSGIEVMEAESFKMTCLQTPTGVKFVVISLPNWQSGDSCLRGVYEVYAEQLRDPFYAAEMPIRSETFDKKIAQVIRSWQ